MKKVRTKGKRLAVCALGLAMALSLGTALAACESGSETPVTPDPDTGTDIVTPSQEEKFTVTFASESGAVYGTQEVEAGAKATLPTYVDANGNAITQWYYKYPSGATEMWSFAGYTVTEDMTLYAAPTDSSSAGAVYELDASLSAYVNAMGGIEFGNGIFTGATITELSGNRYSLSMSVQKSSVTIYGITCDTFIDAAGTNSTADKGVPAGTIGYYDADGTLVTDGISYTLSAENDLVNAPDPEDGSNYTKVRYVTGITMILENVGALESLKELKLTLYINSQVMGMQFCEANDQADGTTYSAKLVIDGMTEIEVPDEPAEEEINGIKDAKIDENGHLILTLSDGTELDAGLVKGESGAQGVGISRIVYEKPVLYFYLTDNSYYWFNLETGESAQLAPNVTETFATCTEDGVRTTYADETKQEVIGVRTLARATGHTYADGVCETCGHEQIDDMTFTRNEDGLGYTLAEYASHAWDTVAVPDTYEGLPVTAIADGTLYMGLVLQSGVFKDHTEIESVTLGKNLQTVGIGAFSDCTALAGVDLSGVTSIGAYAFRNCALRGALSLNGAVSQIPDYAFAGNAALTAVTIPSGVTGIGASAFYNCAGIGELVIPEKTETIGASAFSGLAQIQSVTIPASVTSLGTSAFANCTSLASVQIAAEIGSIPNTLFQNCTSLSRVNSEEEGTFDLASYTQIGNYAFSSTAVKKAVFDPSLTSVALGAFSSCAELVSADFSDNTAGSVTFGNQVFTNCVSLEEAVLPAHTASMGSSLFSGCTSLRSVDLGDDIQTLQGNLFADCASLESITVPDSVTEIGTNVFSGCTGLKSIVFGENSRLATLRGITGCTGLTSLTIPENVTAIAACTGNYNLIEIVNLSSVSLTAGGSDNGGIALYARNIVTSAPESGYVTSGDYTLYHDGNASGEKWYVTAYNGDATEVELPASFTVGETQITSYEIYNRAFYNNDSITSVTIPAGVTAIGAYAFAGCDSLETVAFAEGSALTVIYARAFYNCGALSSVGLPESLTAIGSYAFGSCTALRTIEIPAGVESIESDAFSGCALAEVYNRAAADVQNIPSALNVYTEENGSLLVQSGDFTFLYIPEKEGTPAAAYLVAYTGTGASALTLPESFTAGGVQVKEYAVYDHVFEGMTFSMSVTIPASVTAIGDYAFADVNTLMITFADAGKCESIGAHAFDGCTVRMFNTGLTEASGFLKLEGFRTIGDYAFAGTTNLTSVVIPASVTSIGARVFENSAIAQITFAETRTEELTISNYAFAYMYKLTSVTVPDYVTALVQAMFYGCTALTDVTLPATLVSIGNNAFNGCTALTAMILPASVETVASNSFSSCSQLTYIYVDGSEEELPASVLPSAVRSKAYYYSEEDPINDGNYWYYADGGAIAVWPMV